MFYDDKYVSVLDRHAVMSYTDQSQSRAKKSKKATNQVGRRGEGQEQKEHVTFLNMTQRYEHLAFLGALPPETSDDVNCPLVAVEVRPQLFEAQLPPSLKQKKFGAM